jgi:hypothetical protein
MKVAVNNAFRVIVILLAFFLGGIVSTIVLELGDVFLWTPYGVIDVNK